MTRQFKGIGYYKTKLEEGKTPREAARCLKKTPRRSPLARHDQRRTARDGPGRTPGDGSAIQRGWPNPDDQLFGQVTSRTRHSRCYDGRSGPLTNTEAPKGLLIQKAEKMTGWLS